MEDIENIRDIIEQQGGTLTEENTRQPEET